MAELTDYIIKIIVHYGAGTDSGEDVYLNSLCNTDFSDVRFTDSTGATYLDFWIESKTDSDNAVCWVKVPTIPASPGTVDIRVTWIQGEGNELKFAEITDTHLDPDGDRLDLPSIKRTECVQRMGDFVTRMSTFQPDFCVSGGDTYDISWDGDANQTKAETQMATFINNFNNLGSTLKIYVPGNHDFNYLTEAQWSSIVSAYVPYFESGKCYGSFDYGDYHIVVLDHNFDSDLSTHADSGTGSLAYVSSAQLTWLAVDLAATTKKTLIFCHRPLTNAFFTLWPYSDTPWVANADDVRDILEASGVVIAVFSGHIHQVDYSNVNGINYINCPSLVDDLAYYRLTSDANFDGHWAEITINDFRKEIKYEYYQNLSAGSSGVVHTHYLYYTFDEYGKATNPSETFSFDYTQNREQPAINLTEAEEFSNTGDYHLLAPTSDTRVIDIKYTNDTEASEFPYTPMRVFSLTAVDGDTGGLGFRFANRTGLFICEFDISVSQINKKFSIHLGQSGTDCRLAPTQNNTGPYLIFDSDGDLKYNDGSDNVILTYTADTLYQVKFIIDTIADTYDIYINDNLEVEGAAFWGTLTYLSCFTIRRLGVAAGHPIEFFLGNIRLRAFSDPEPTLGSWVEVTT